MSCPSAERLALQEQIIRDQHVALEAAEKFIADELEQRRNSFVPAGDELGYIAEAESVLAVVRVGLERGKSAFVLTKDQAREMESRSNA